MIFIHKINTGADFVTAQAVIPADNCLMGHYDSHILMLYPHQGISVVTQIGRIHANPVAIYCRIFKWTWRVLNFVREMVLNLFFIFLVLVGVGIWMQIGNGSNSEQTARGALLLDISGVIVDKPSTNHRLGALGRQLFGASSDRLQENSCLTSSTLFVRRKMTVTSRVSFWI